jgi:hypothetical protein
MISTIRGNYLDRRHIRRKQFVGHGFAQIFTDKNHKYLCASVKICVLLVKQNAPSSQGRRDAPWYHPDWNTSRQLKGISHSKPVNGGEAATATDRMLGLGFTAAASRRVQPHGRSPGAPFAGLPPGFSRLAGGMAYYSWAQLFDCAIVA